MRGLFKFIGFVVLTVPSAIIYGTGWAFNKLTGNGIKKIQWMLKPREEKFYRAVERNDVETVRRLVRSNVTVDAADVLHKAVQYRYQEITDILLSSGIDPNCKDDYNRSALHYALKNGYNQASEVLAKKLINAGSDVNARDNYGATPLHFLTESNSGAVMEKMLPFLLEKGADINAQNNDGLTPLHHAIRWRNIESIEHLIQAGADVTIATKERETALDLAKEGKNTEIIEIIEKAADVQLKKEQAAKAAESAAIKASTQRTIEQIDEALKQKTFKKPPAA